MGAPYRWMRHPLCNMGHWWRMAHYGARNLLRWFPVIWNDRDWDWAYMATLIARKLRFMEHEARTCWSHVGALGSARDMAICRTALERVVADNYLLDRMEKGDVSHDDCRLANAQLDDEWRMACEIIARKARTWWD